MTDDELLAIAPGLVPLEPGLLAARASTPSDDVAYPAGAHAAYAEIEERSFWFRHRNRCLLAVLRAWPPAGTLFDVGGGNGFVARALAEAGFDVVLVEPGRDGARRARARGLGPVACATLEAAAFAPHSLPAAGLFDVLEHLEDDEGFLRGLRGRLVPGARVYITVPAGPRLWSSEDVYAGHFRRYRRRDLARLLARAGYEVEFVSCFFAPLPPLVYALRVLPERLGRAPRTDARAARGEHAADARLAPLIDAVLGLEPALLRRRLGLPFGSSCLAVARAAS
jgi:SAM-dependent methyltransferase